jgi:hypothetical protein
VIGIFHSRLREGAAGHPAQVCQPLRTARFEAVD